MSEEEQESKTFEDFYAFYKEKPELDNKEYYEAFPHNAMATVRAWKSKARAKKMASSLDLGVVLLDEPDKPKDKVKQKSQLEFVRDLLIEAYRPSYQEKKLLDTMSIEQQVETLKKLKADRDAKGKPTGNRAILPTSLGINTKERGIDQYIEFDQAKGEIRMEFPPNVILDPEKNKKLGEYI